MRKKNYIVLLSLIILPIPIITMIIYININNALHSLDNSAGIVVPKTNPHCYHQYGCKKQQADEIQVDNSSMENMLVMKDIRNMISNYLDEMDDAVKARRSRMVDDYLNHYSESTKTHQYIVEYTQKLNNNTLNVGAQLAMMDLPLYQSRITAKESVKIKYVKY